MTPTAQRRQGGQGAAGPAPTGAARIWQPPRDLVRRVACPECHVGPGQPCERARGQERHRHHFARVELVWPAELREPRRERPDFGAVAAALTADVISAAGRGVGTPLAS